MAAEIERKVRIFFEYVAARPYIPKKLVIDIANVIGGLKELDRVARGRIRYSLETVDELFRLLQADTDKFDEVIRAAATALFDVERELMAVDAASTRLGTSLTEYGTQLERVNDALSETAIRYAEKGLILRYIAALYSKLGKAISVGTYNIIAQKKALGEYVPVLDDAERSLIDYIEWMERRGLPVHDRLTKSQAKLALAQDILFERYREARRLLSMMRGAVLSAGDSASKLNWILAKNAPVLAEIEDHCRAVIPRFDQWRRGLERMSTVVETAREGFVKVSGTLSHTVKPIVESTRVSLREIVDDWEKLHGTITDPTVWEKVEETGEIFRRVWESMAEAPDAVMPTLQLSIEELLRSVRTLAEKAGVNFDAIYEHMLRLREPVDQVEYLEKVFRSLYDRVFRTGGPLIRDLTEKYRRLFGRQRLVALSVQDLTERERDLIRSMVDGRAAYLRLSDQLFNVVHARLLATGIAKELGLHERRLSWHAARLADQLASQIVRQRAIERLRRHELRQLRVLAGRLRTASWRLSWFGYRMTIIGRIVQRWFISPVHDAIAAMVNWEKTLATVMVSIGMLAAQQELTEERFISLMDVANKLIELGPKMEAAWFYFSAGLLAVSQVIADPFIPLLRELGDYLMFTIVPLLRTHLVPAFNEFVASIIGGMPNFRSLAERVVPAFAAGFRVGAQALLGMLDALGPFLPALARLLGFMTPFAPLMAVAGTGLYLLGTAFSVVGTIIGSFVSIAKGVSKFLGVVGVLTVRASVRFQRLGRFVGAVSTLFGGLLKSLTSTNAILALLAVTVLAIVLHWRRLAETFRAFVTPAVHRLNEAFKEATGGLTMMQVAMRILKAITLPFALGLEAILIIIGKLIDGVAWLVEKLGFLFRWFKRTGESAAAAGVQLAGIGATILKTKEDVSTAGLSIESTMRSMQEVISTRSDLIVTDLDSISDSATLIESKFKEIAEGVKISLDALARLSREQAAKIGRVWDEYERKRLEQTSLQLQKLTEEQERYTDAFMRTARARAELAERARRIPIAVPMPGAREIEVFQRGGVVRRPTLAFLHPGEVVLPRGVGLVQNITVHASIEIGTVTGVADLDLVTDAVSRGIAEAAKRVKP